MKKTDDNGNVKSYETAHGHEVGEDSMMLDDLKKNMNKKSVTAFILFGAIIIVFVFFGYQGKMKGGGGAGFAARVNDRIITVADFQNSLNQMTRQYAPLFGDKLNQNPQLMQRLRGMALSQLIQREIVSQGAFQEGFSVTNAQIREVILKVPAFQKDGVFQRAYYDGYLENSHTTAAHFEEQLRHDLVIDLLRESIAEGFTPFDAEVAKIEKLKSKQYVLDYVKFDSEDFKKKVNISDSEVTDFLKDKDNQLRVQLEFDKNKATKYKDKKLEDVQKEIAKQTLAEDKTEKMSQELGLKIKNPGEFEAAIQKLGLKWQTTKPFSMDQNRIAELGASERLMSRVFKLSKKGEMVPEVFSTPQGTFAVRLNSVSEKTPLDDKGAGNLKEQVASQRANEAFMKWADELSRGYSVQTNPDVIGAGVTPE